MSGKVMGWIWDADIEDKAEKFILLAYADHADHDGGGIYPSVSLICWKTGYTDRHVRRVKQDLIARGYMVQTGWSEHQTPIYKIVKGVLPEREDWHRKQGGRPRKPPVTENTPVTGVSPVIQDNTPVTGVTPPLTSTTNPPDTGVSQTVIEPSMNRPKKGLSQQSSKNGVPLPSDLATPQPITEDTVVISRPTAADTWAAIKLKLKNQLSQAVFDSHINLCEPISLTDGGVLTIEVLSPLSYSWLSNRLYKQVHDAALSVNRSLTIQFCQPVRESEVV